jgi:hypothetical protein
MLTIYEKHPEADAYKVGSSYAPYALVARANRFTEAELAAEYQRGEFDYERAFHGMRYLSGNWNPDKFATYERREILERFATLPHFDGAS